MEVIHPGCGLRMATSLAQHSPEALEIMVGPEHLGVHTMLLSCTSGFVAADICCYTAAAESIGVCAEPELAIRNLTPANPFFLLGSDGVFEFMPSQTVVDMVRHICLCDNLHTYAGSARLLSGKHVTPYDTSNT